MNCAKRNSKFKVTTRMCGIAGFTLFHKDAIDAPALLEKMGAAIRHRGPDAGGIFSDDGVGLCLSLIHISEPTRPY